jgi:hypothetical protein
VLINLGQHSVGVLVVGPDARMIQSAESELKHAAEEAGASIEDEHPRDIPHLDRESSYSGFTAEDEPEYLSDLVEAIKKAAKRISWISGIQVARGHWPKIASKTASDPWKVNAGFSQAKQAASGPNPTGSNWTKMERGEGLINRPSWLWDDGTTSFHVLEFQGPGIPLYSMQLITSFGDGSVGPLKLRRPHQTKSPEQMFAIAADWYKSIEGFRSGNVMGLDLTNDWTKA